MSNVETIQTKHLFLWCMSCIYFFAFSSLYFQVPGLYGRKGLLPAVKTLDMFCSDADQRCVQWASYGECKNNQLWMKKNCLLSCDVCKEGEELSLQLKLQRKLTLLWFAPCFGLNTESGMELLCVLGVSLSCGAILSKSFRNRFVLFILWAFYFSLYQVGQTFLWFQWDILLLEIGFITWILAPNKQSPTEEEEGPHHNLIFFLVKWLLFRLMFASGVVKLSSECPTWWGLTALNWHYESQCIPTPLAWYAHQMPDALHGLSVIATYVIEIGLPFLFFVPIRSWRLFAFYGQMLLQVLIILTGNYNFFNLLTMTLCISLIDDQHIDRVLPRPFKIYFKFSKPKKTSVKRPLWVDYILIAMNTFFSFASIYWIKNLFNIQLWPDGTLTTKIAFTKDEFYTSVNWLTRYSVCMGIIAYIVTAFQALYTSAMKEFVNKFYSSITQTVTMLSCGLVLWLFAISLVPLTEVDQNVQKDLWPIIKQWHFEAREYEITHSYGLFRRMTGVGGRPEIIIEGANDLKKGPWKEFNFLYKPGKVNGSLPFVAPHQPRLDWQMWFAALGSYQHNPWFIHLIYKLLEGESDVLHLLDENPFPNQPPIYVRSRLFTYHYTTLSKQTTGVVDGLLRARRIQDWWRRDSPKEYTPPLSVHDSSLQHIIKSMGVLEKDLRKEKVGGKLYFFIRMLRKFSVKANPTWFMCQVMLFYFCYQIVKYYSRS